VRSAARRFDPVTPGHTKTRSVTHGEHWFGGDAAEARSAEHAWGGIYRETVAARQLEAALDPEGSTTARAVLAVIVGRR
jgi:hypothetical protein